MAGKGKKLSDAYVELGVDDTKAVPQVKVKAKRMGREFGGALNNELKRLSLDPIDIKASPADALKAADRIEEKLREVSRDAATVEIRVRAEKALGDLDRFRKRLGKAGEEAAPEVSTKLFARLGPLIASMPVSGPMSTALIGAAVAAAPLLGATVAGAIIGGAGLGGIAGGIYAARNDERVVASLKGLKNQFEDRLELSAGRFVGPLLGGIAEIRAALNSVDIDRIFRNTAPYVQVLARGVGSLIESIGNAVETLSAKAGPAIAAISGGIALIGDALEEGMISLADNGESAADALTTLFGIIGSGITTTFRLINALTELYEISHNLGLDIGLQLLIKATGGAMKDTKKSADDLAGSTTDLGFRMDEAKAAAERQKDAQELLTAAQEELSGAQTRLKDTLDALSPAAGRAKQNVDALRQASEAMYGAARAGADANQSYEASWDALTDSVKANKGTLDVHTAAGRSNRDALKALLTSNNELYFANIAQGQSTEQARKKHEARTAAVKEEARRLGLNKKETDELIKTYGRIPPKKTTELVLAKVAEVADALLDLAAIQLHLAKGTPLNPDLQRRLARAQYGMPDTKRAVGGPLPGHAPHDRADNVVYAGTPGEWVIQRPTVRKVEHRYGQGAMEYFNRYGELPLDGAYASGGRLAGINFPRNMLYRVTAAETLVPSLRKVIDAVIPSFGAWPSSPGAQRGDSGVWRRIIQLIRSSGINEGSFGNAYRPGDPKWHGSGRAVDWMGFNMDRLATFLASKRPLELIHRTRTRDYAYTRGQNRGSFNEALMNAHRNHIHIAMAHGGQVPVRQVAMADTGRVTLKPGLNLVGNGTGVDEHLSTAAAGGAALARIAEGIAALEALMIRLISVTAANPQAFAGAMNRTGPGLIAAARRA